MGSAARWAGPAAAALAIALATAAHAGDGEASQVAPVTVIATTPLPGTAIDVAKLPYDVSTITGADLNLAGPPSLTRTLEDRIGAVSVNDNLGDAFQPDILYRGFTASPVLGAPEGLAVYQNGVRINEPFGDAVNWDLVPSGAVARTDVVGTSPVYGLNALGGAIVMTMKNGFDDAGGEATLTGGAFGLRSADAAYGVHSGRWGVFVAARALDDDGWRLFSVDRVRQLYADLSWRGERLSLDLSYTGADNSLHGESATPVQELAVGRQLIFTSPQVNANRLNFVALGADFTATPSLSLQSNLYVRGFSQHVANGNATDDTACAGAALAGRLCQPDAVTPLVDVGGGQVPDLSQGGRRPIGENDRETLGALGFGGAFQGAWTAHLLGRPNQLSAGVDGEGAGIDFASDAELGVIAPDLVVQPSPYIVSTPEGTPFTATPVSLRADTAYAGAFVTDTLDLTPRLSLTASGRVNWIRIALHDQLGARLSGTNPYAHVNPAVGAAWRAADWLTAYAGFAEGSRAPTPGEIECSSPAAPCLLPSSLSADPHGLKQVVSGTLEAGLRGGRPLWRGSLSYSFGLYRTDVHDDIYAVATSLSSGYFRNIAGTRRQGGELALTYRDPRLLAYASYAYVAATFAATFLLPSPSNPLADGAGDILVRPGDQLPGIPRHRLKVGADWAVGGGVRIGGDLEAFSSQAYRGDEANLLAPLPGYAVVGVHATWAVNRRVSLFVRGQNVLNARYANFGVLGDPAGVGAPGVPTDAARLDPRFQSPGAPAAVEGGVEMAF